MTYELLLNDDWGWMVERLGGAETLTESARATKAFVRARGVRSAVDLLRLTLAYCLSHTGLRGTAGWAAAVGLAKLSDVALLLRLRNTSDWLLHLIARLLGSGRPAAAEGRLIRILDATTVLKAGQQAKRSNGLWRVHSAFELPAERFGFLALTDERGGERLDRVPVVPAETCIADGAYLQPDQMSEVISQGADVLLRAGWHNARWLDQEGVPLDLVAALSTKGQNGLLDRPVWIGRKGGTPLALRPSRCANRLRPRSKRDAGRAFKPERRSPGFGSGRSPPRNGSSCRPHSRLRLLSPQTFSSSTVCAGASSLLSND